METVDNRSFKEKFKDFWRRGKNKVGETVDKGKKFAGEHKEEIAVFAILFGPGLVKLMNTALRARMQMREDRYDECNYYDPRTGEHWYTRKPLTSRQKLNLETRYNNGESKGEILRSMGML